MHFSCVVVILLVSSLSNALPSPHEDTAPTYTLPAAASTDVAEASKQLDQLAKFAQQQARSLLKQEHNGEKPGKGKCTLENVAIRREWGSLSPKERIAYTDAVRCFQKKQAKTPASLVPGARSRYDDWIGTHINQTVFIHYSGTFLTWHRFFTWHYEQALRNECGYTGYQPYWNWALTAVTGLEESPLLDGSDTSMGSNGEFVPGQGTVIFGGPGLPEILLPSGTGGGCVTSGPFKDMTVNLGPLALGLANGSTIGLGDGLGYNPRCLKRDLTTWINRNFANASSVARVIIKPKDIYDFQMTMQGYPGSGDLGIHGGGHYSMGGDPARDAFVSPGDPLFYLHHAMIDRVWWTWQLLDNEKRTGAEGISGTGTFLDTPPSANTTLDTVIDLGFAAGPPQTVRDLLSTTAGPFCYIYL
ncbi:Di-copper centre-containing protein [Aaosphaeria arxii CBS 175.79]|uniref:Di-copper centre-containing protein n=1 Tax=Aaosphaeria arxii CBS 175.79 TaxID=1450172 RepID=A0A6A5Y9G4_9PLEO|nr:Di-copper centre-containing protein [Aaosphaeria arxii CBS 175.79]KAF2021979.1 Di-copper centre-containing protein [Aaosphaeria arxii CBS 175.79]